jgi:glycosyltransferase involved in cell wall biosynthesis
LEITFLYQYFGTPKGSWSTRVYELTKRWVDAGHDVTVITSPYDKSDIKADGLVSFQQIDGIKLIVINSGDSNRMAIWRRVIRALKFSMISSFYTLKLDADVIIASSGPITIGIPGLMGKFFKRVPLVFEVRDLWPDGGIEMGLIKGKISIQISRLFEKIIYKNSSLIVTASLGQKNQIGHRFNDLKILNIPNASDIDLFQKSSREEKIPEIFKDKPLILHIGSLGFIHNCIHLVKVAKELKGKGYEDKLNIVFLGEGKDRKMLEDFVTENNITNVFFLGLKPKNDLVAWLQQAKATLFTTLNNPIQDTCSPNKIFDSFAAGVPIIQTTQGWIKDLVEDNFCGINVEPDNVSEMANSIIHLLNNEMERKLMGENALILAKTEFNRDLLAQKYLSALTENVKA